MVLLLFNSRTVLYVLSLALFQSQSYSHVVAAATTTSADADADASTDALHMKSSLSLSLATTLSSSTCAYGFTVCSPSGGSQSVDFRSHFAVYAAQYKLSGWVRNGCQNCVYGMFAGGMIQNSNTGTPLYCNNAHAFASILQNSARIVQEFDSKAGDLIATVEEMNGYPNNPQLMCPTSNGNTILPDGYIKPTHAIVDWNFSKDGCTTPCDCIPTSPVKDCQGSDPLPAGTHYTKDCQRFPLGSDTKHFPDCNSMYVHNGQNCFEIYDGGTLGVSGNCGIGGTNFDWVNNTLAAQCCGPWDPTNKYGRAGMFPHPFANCTTYDDKCNSYDDKCKPCPPHPNL